MGGGVLVVVFVYGLAGVVVWFSRRWVRVMLGTGGMPSLVSGYICIMCEVWFHSFGVLGFLWLLCVVGCSLWVVFYG